MRRIISTLTLSLLISFLFGQSTIRIKVVNESNQPIPNAEVYFFSKTSHQVGVSDANGEAEFPMPDMATAIIAFDQNGTYGLNAFKIDYSASEYKIRLPRKPKNESDAGMQMDCVFNKISTAYGYAHDGIFIAESIKAIKAGASGAAMPSMGVPGVFSINPFPVIGEDGKLKMQISGVLVDKLVNLWYSSRQFKGIKVNYYYGAVM
jgi:hypothetical protein